MYLTITESKRKFNADNGNFFYEKHKIFLYKEDFEKFKNALTGVIDFIENGIVPEDTFIENDNFEKTEDDMDLGITFDDIDLSL